MVINRCIVICFSPTGSTKRIAESIAEGTGLPVTVYDLTLPQARKNAHIDCGKTDLAVLAVPVYFGRVPRTAVAALAQVKGNKTPAILVANYGNRNYDDALLELQELAGTSGFVPVTAGAFVSRHSYHTEAYPLAAGRPDKNDLEQAVRFGQKSASLAQLAGNAKLALPGTYPYRPYPELFRAPLVTEKCTGCGLCVTVCPTGTMHMEKSVSVTDEKSCIICQACVQVCPQGARQDIAPGAKETRERLTALIAIRHEPELFYSRSVSG